MKTRILLAAVILGGLGLISAYGQMESIKTTVDFSFSVGGKVLPAGQYEFSRSAEVLIFRVQGEGMNAAEAPVLTRLAGAIHTTPEDAHIVFDKVGDAYILSEIWIPGEDGFLLAVTKEPHEHIVINVKY